MKKRNQPRQNSHRRVLTTNLLEVVSGGGRKASVAYFVKVDSETTTQ